MNKYFKIISHFFRDVRIIDQTGCTELDGECKNLTEAHTRVN